MAAGTTGTFGRLLTGVSVTAIIAAGCGAYEENADGQASAARAAPKTDTVLRVRPPIQAVNRPAPEVLAFLEFDPDDFASSNAVCSLQTIEVVVPGSAATSASEPGDSTASKPCSEADMREEMRYEREVSLAPGSTPRALAELPLRAGGTAVFVEYLARSGRYCGFLYEEDGDGGVSGGDQSGPPCAREDGGCIVCIEATRAWEPVPYSLLSGTLPSDAEAVRLTFDDGSVASYPLTGPLMRSDPARRVFLVEVEGDPWYRRLEVLRDGVVVDAQEVPALPEDADFRGGATG